MSDTIYKAEPLYSRYDVPYVLPAVLDALRARRINIAAINTSHVLFTVCIAQHLLCANVWRCVPELRQSPFAAVSCCVSRLLHVTVKKAQSSSPKEAVS